MRKLTIAGVVILLILFVLGLFGDREDRPEREDRPGRISIATVTPAPPATPATPAPTRTFAQWKLRAEEIPYDTLLRSADQLKGKLVYFRGEVGFDAGTREQAELKVRVKERGSSWDRDSEVLVYYRNPVVRVFEGDIIEFVGKVDGYYPFNPIPAVVAVTLEIERD